MKYKERYKDVFSQIEPAEKFDPEEFCMKRTRKNITKKLVCAAAVAAVLTSLCLAAYATDFFGLRELLLPQQHEIILPKEPEDTGDGSPAEQEQQTQLVDVISLVGYSDTAEAKATAEWQAFLASYDDGGVLEQIGNAPTGFEEEYGLYLVYTQEMADQLDEITARYGLKLHTTTLVVSPDELCGQVGGDFYGENRFGAAYLYEDGTFGFDGEIELDGYGLLDYQFLRAVRGSFTDTLLNIGDINAYTEWSYITQDGTTVTLALSSHKALVIADLPDSFVTINVLAGTDTPLSDVFSNGPLTAEALERLADSFAFSLLTPASPIDESLLELAEQQKKELEDSSKFWTITGMEEWQAQEFYARWLLNAENGDRMAVAEKLLYPATVSVWETTEAGTFLVEHTVESAEDFLLYYDDIFTESLWESVQHNQYTKERADLIPDNGMVGAAGGAVWFALTENDGIKVFTIQNGEGCSVRQPQSGITYAPVSETRYDSARTAYTAVLSTLLYERSFPDGTPYDPFMDGSADQFALVDLHGDGTEELVLLATNSCTAGQVGYVVSWDEKTGTPRIELREYPSLTFYDNGYVQAWAAHNQGLAGDALWPYTLYRYDSAAGVYQSVAMVDAWDSALGDRYYDMFFPGDIDRSGTGVVYYVMKPGNYDLSAPMDAADYEAWVSAWMDGAEVIEIPYQDLTVESIMQLQENE